MLARELSRPLKLLVASQPTRGVDVGSIEFLHNRIVAERDNGTAVLIVSTELDEIAALADRVAVMYRGRVVGVVPADTPRDELGLMMAGASKQRGRRSRRARTRRRWEPSDDTTTARPQQPPSAAGAGATASGRAGCRLGGPGPGLAGAIVLALLVGAVLIIISDERRADASGYFFAARWTPYPRR